jgi:hypothetical protein
MKAQIQTKTRIQGCDWTVFVHPDKKRGHGDLPETDGDALKAAVTKCFVVLHGHVPLPRQAMPWMHVAVLLMHSTSNVQVQHCAGCLDGMHTSEVADPRSMHGMPCLCGLCVVLIPARFCCDNNHRPLRASPRTFFFYSDKLKWSSHAPGSSISFGFGLSSSGEPRPSPGSRCPIGDSG